MSAKNKELLGAVKCFLFDMDGTIYLGDRLLPGAAAALAAIKDSGRSYYFLTNNSSKNEAYYQGKLAKMGIAAKQDDIIISTRSLLFYLSDKPGRKLFVLGTDELKDSLAAAGCQVLTEGGQNPDYVVVGFDTGLNYKTLTAACQYVDKGVPYVATHPDVRCPLDGGLFMPDCGSIVALIKAATGRECLFVAGKPSKAMISVALERTGFAPGDLAVVGDRLYTDIALGFDNGLLSVLLLSGEAIREDLKDSRVQPDIVLNGIGDLMALL